MGNGGGGDGERWLKGLKYKYRYRELWFGTIIGGKMKRVGNHWSGG